MKFGWDEKKRRRNLDEHGVDFADATRFEFASALGVEDDRRDYGEVRQAAIGFVGERMHVMVFTDRDD